MMMKKQNPLDSNLNLKPYEELKPFENDILNLVKQLKFTKVNNKLQEVLKKM